MFSSQITWAQKGGNGGSGGTGDPGYDIMGEANPVPAPDTYRYDYVQPDHDPQLYWSVVGAETINGKPAESWAEGSLLVDDYPSLEIAWQDSIQGGRLALRTKVPIKGQDSGTETQERFSWWVAIISPYTYLFCDPDIQWSTGSVYYPPTNNLPIDYYNFSHNGLIYDDQGFCRSQVLTLRFKNTWGINCFGGTRPYSWRFNYATDQGHTYVETWSSTENIVTPQLYEQVPLQPFTSGLAQLGGLRPETFGSFNTTLFTTATSGLTAYNGSTSTTTNPYQNERIVRVQIVAVGRSCGSFGSCGDLTTTTGIIVYGLDAASNITAREILSNNQLGNPIPDGQGLCVGRRYQISATSDHAFTFDWTTNLGTINSAGVTATLDLTQVTAANAPFQVQLTASPRAANQSCLSSPLPTTATFYFRDTPAPQNLKIDGNPQICSTPVVRTIRIDPVAGATQYNWQVVSGPGNFSGRTTASGQLSSISLTFTGPGTVQVQVTAQDNCNRLSQYALNSFSPADPNAVPAPLPTTLLQGYDAFPWSFANPHQNGQLNVNNPQSGIAYTFSIVDADLFNQKANGTYFPGDPKSTGGGASSVRLIQVAGGTSAELELLDARVASVRVRVTAYNGCGNSGQTQARDFDLVRPFHGLGLHLTAGGNENDEDSATGTGTDMARTAASAALAETKAAVAANAAPQLYPNPARDQLQIVAASPDTHYEYVVVLNAQGSVVQEVRSAEGVQTLSLQALPPGIYAVRLFDGKQFVTQRITKE